MVGLPWYSPEGALRNSSAVGNSTVQVELEVDWERVFRSVACASETCSPSPTSCSLLPSWSEVFQSTCSFLRQAGHGDAYWEGVFRAVACASETCAPTACACLPAWSQSFQEYCLPLERTGIADQAVAPSPPMPYCLRGSYRDTNSHEVLNSAARLAAGGGAFATLTGLLARRIS
eukprot:8386430-Alexandrium_andersonii.AAC.1